MNEVLQFEKDILNTYRMKKLNISSESKISDIDEVYKLMYSYIGLHAARIGKPYISLLSKNVDIHINDLYKKINFNEEFITRRCMRKTLHICNRTDLPMIHNATLQQRLPKLKEESYLIDKSEDIIINKLSANSCERDELYQTLMTKLSIQKDTAKKLLEYNYENGLIYFTNISESVYKEKRLYLLQQENLLKQKNGDINENIDEAIEQLVERYIKCFGPVSKSDICWWSGLSKGRVDKALNKIKEKISWISVEENNELLCIFKDEVLKIKQNSDIVLGDCKFMAYEDTTLKAYYSTRNFYADNPKQYFNQIGEIYATIFLAGKAIGIWSLDVKKNEIIIESVEANKSQYEIILKEKSRMEELLF